MGNWFSSSRPSSPAPTLTSIQPLEGVDTLPTPRTPTSTSTLPTTPATTDDGSDMFRSRYNNPIRYDFSSRYNRNRVNRFTRRRPWYGNPRWRERASDRDRAFWVDLNDENDSRFPRPRQPDVVVVDTPEIPPNEVAKQLNVTDINLHIDENAKEHNTDDYECNEKRTREKPDGTKIYMKPELVIRRGKDFKMTITFDRPFNVKKNDISLTFNMGDKYKPNKNLTATFFVKEPGESANYKPKHWGASVVGQSGNSLTINVFTPATIPVGEWEFCVTTTDNVNGKKKTIQYNHNEDINIIFNPWCKEDVVYLSDKAWLKEAVLNDKGAVYQGSSNRMGAKPWTFGQFKDGMLDCAFHLVRKSFKFRAAPGMANAATIARNISKLVNAPDDSGVLEGKWNGGYSGGIKPTKWSDSTKILEKYMDQKAPVKYGQCWVFSAVVTTVCRALGMPCRSITNFASAHNTDKDNLTIDYYKNGDKYEADGDSIWNFHVWNEVWMSRRDLDESGKWDGWQVIDATPQELSDGVFCCGPAPVKAVKEGEITVGKDTEFVFSEVNADKVQWDWDNQLNKLVVNKRLRALVGKNISTHQPTGRAYRSGTSGGNMERLDVTDEYKYTEGSEQERKIVRKAERKIKLLTSGNADESDEEEEVPQRVEIKIEDPGDLFVGTPFAFVVHMKNITRTAIVIKTALCEVSYKSYSGSYGGNAKRQMEENIKLEPGRIHTMQVNMDEKTTIAQPEDSFIFELNASASFHDTDHCETEELTFRMRRPDIVIKGPTTCQRFRTVEVELIFTNPLNTYLTNCEIELGGGFYPVEPRTDKFRIADIGPRQTWRQTIRITPHWYPRNNPDRELNVGFDSNELPEIVGCHNMEMTR